MCADGWNSRWQVGGNRASDTALILVSNKTKPAPAERPAWTCSRCGRVSDFEGESPEDAMRWEITRAGRGALPRLYEPRRGRCDRIPELWFDRKSGETRIAMLLRIRSGRGTGRSAGC
jgi:hypothetical protein